VTTEDDFQAALDEHPDDWQTRLVFADWLQECGDPRADGYRALGVRRRVPEPYTNSLHPGRWKGATEYTFWGLVLPHEYDKAPERIEADWFAGIPRDESNPDDRGGNYRSRPTRRAIEDAAALAFAKLPAERRAELLTPAEPPKRSKSKKR
jgi:uncharacterized protein (TIGR02996 family)